MKGGEVMNYTKPSMQTLNSKVAPQSNWYYVEMYVAAIGVAVGTVLLVAVDI